MQQVQRRGANVRWVVDKQEETEGEEKDLLIYGLYFIDDSCDDLLGASHRQ